MTLTRRNIFKTSIVSAFGLLAVPKIAQAQPATCDDTTDAYSPILGTGTYNGTTSPVFLVPSGAAFIVCKVTAPAPVFQGKKSPNVDTQFWYNKYYPDQIERFPPGSVITIDLGDGSSFPLTVRNDGTAVLPPATENHFCNLNWNEVGHFRPVVAS